MTSRERRFGGLTRTALMAGARCAPRFAAERFSALASAPDLAEVGQVRTSAAFAARFDAEAGRSGLALDWARGGTAELARACRGCGAQVGLYDQRCFNCGLDLGVAEQEAADASARAAQQETAWAQGVRAGLVPEARFARVLAAPTLSTRPYRLRLTGAVSRWETVA